MNHFNSQVLVIQSIYTLVVLIFIGAIIVEIHQIIEMHENRVYINQIVYKINLYLK